MRAKAAHAASRHAGGHLAGFASPFGLDHNNCKQLTVRESRARLIPEIFDTTVGGPLSYPIVYTMGKVGSRALAQGIRDAGFECPDVHTLNHENLLANAGKSIVAGELPAAQLLGSMLLKRKLNSKKIRKPLYVTAVREPLSRNISAFFQNHKTNLETIDISRSDVDNARQALKIFMESYPHEIALTWLERELHQQVGIDLYETPFDPKKRYARSKRVVVFRDDCPNDLKSKVLSDALGRPITIARQNVGDNKRYSRLYKMLKEISSFDIAFLDKIYRSKYARHFWTDEEIDGFRQAWLSSAH